jgi:hypothetical protein
MMSAALALALAGGLLALVGRFFAEPAAASTRRFAAPLLALTVAVGAFATVERGSAGAFDVVALATAPDGASVATTVTLQRADGGRTVRRIELSRPLPAAAPVLVALAGLATLLAVVGLSGRVRGAHARLGTAALAGLTATAGAVLSAGGTGSGESEVRARLGELVVMGLGAPASFTVPEGSWTYAAGGALPLFAAAAVMAALVFMPARSLSSAPRLVMLGAVLCALAPVVDIVATGGFAWRPTTAAFWALGLAVAGAAFERDAARAAGLTGVTAGLALALL